MGVRADEFSSKMQHFLEQVGGCAVIDGGLATELERHGADLNDPLWSAKCLISSPHLIRQESTGVPDEDFVSYVSNWREVGVSLIGGCCRTTPNTIRDICRALNK